MKSNVVFFESRKRSWLKAITWRIIGIILLVIIGVCLLDNWKQITHITIIFHVIRLILYYFHERIWQLIQWGIEQ